METRRTILLMVFGLSLIMLWDRWQAYNNRNAPHGQPPAISAPAPTAAPSPGTVSAAPEGAPATAAVAGQAGGLEAAGGAVSSGERIQIETDLVRAEFDPLGASLVRVELPKEKQPPDWTEQGLTKLLHLSNLVHSMGFGHAGGESDIVLLQTTAQRTYEARSGLTGGSPQDPFPNHRATRFSVSSGPRTLAPGQDTLTVRFEAEAGGVRLVKTFTFRRGHYDIAVSHDVTNVGSAAVTPALYLELVRDGGKAVDESTFARSYTGPAFYTQASKYKKVSFEDIEKNKAEVPQPADDGWFAVVQHYFVAGYVPAAGARRDFYAETLKPGELYRVGARVTLPTLAPGASSSEQATLYVGPQEQKTLEAIAPGLDLVADYGSLTFIAKPLFWLLGALHWGVSNWGWAIVLLTVLIKGMFYPLSAASYKSMAKMKELQPRMAKMKEQYGEDRQKLQLAMMELYKKEQINPLMGCLPIAVQIPVFLALYWVLLASVEMRNAPWILWIHDLAAPDPWFVLPVVMMASMWVQYKLNPTPPDPVQARMMAIMPFVFGVMFFFFPAGLVLYWVVNNALSILQQWRITQVVARAKKPG
ncbi:MAG: membrane protein insertase YidC [Burkholderiaceae bacterium]|nr:membrane protein insertase YidC [Burkholderiaceae bacterium]